MPALEVTDLVVRYGDITAVDGVSFGVDAGEIVALLGPNGAGKTSTIETLEGFRRPTSGQVRVMGFDPHTHHDAVTAVMGVMLQEGGVYPGIRVQEILNLYAGFFVRPQDPEMLLGLVGLQHRARAMWRHLSGGEQQRLSLALALVGSPQAVLLDEPSAGVDVAGRQLVRDVIRGLADRGTAVLVTTHDLAEAEKISDRIVIMHHGSVVGAGTPKELLTAEPIAEIHFSTSPNLDVIALGAHLHAPVRQIEPGAYVVETDPAPEVIAALTSWLAQQDCTLRDLRAGRQSLEDVFLALTADDHAPERRHAGH